MKKRLLKKKWYAFCIASMGAVLKNPRIIKRLFRAVFYRGESPPDGQRALLSSIAVSPNVQKIHSCDSICGHDIILHKQTTVSILK